MHRALSIPQPCAESWAAMMPTATGRHCAACAKTVVDFTLKTDAEILAYLAGAANGRTCGRFAAGQLERPLQRAVPAAPSARWRAWLAALVAIWAVREGVGTEATAQARTEWRARYWGGPVPAAPVGEAKETPESAVSPLLGRKPAITIVLPEVTKGPSITMGMVSSQSMKSGAAPLVLRGTITDFSDNTVIPGVTVLLKGTTIGTSTTADGSYELVVPAELATVQVLDVIVSSIGFVLQERMLTTKTASEPQNFRLQVQMMGQLIERRPWPWHPRALYGWGKYWLTRPFRRG